ncbi:hypothetical protein F5146DRAFT_1137262 [Armillaria mellea]|nr:hypothetical protein F5146DRAFT_1137262 [Armillaria mellea]
MASEFSNIIDEEASRHHQYPMSYVASDTEDVEYASTSFIRTSTRSAVVGNLQPSITRAPARQAHGSFTPPLRQHSPFHSSAEDITRSPGQISRQCRLAGWCQLICTGFIGGVVVTVSSRLVLVLVFTWYTNHGFV